MTQFTEEEMLSAARFLIDRGKADKPLLAKTPEWLIWTWARASGWKGVEKNG